MPDGRLRHPSVSTKAAASAVAATALFVAVGGQAPSRQNAGHEVKRHVLSARPGPDNTGVPPGTLLTRFDGDLVITTPGATFDALDIHGFVRVKAHGVTITRSIVRGGTATTNTGLVTNYDTSATGFLLEDSELVPAHPSVWIDGIKGAHFTLRRVDVHGTTDAVKVQGDDVTVEQSWLHDTVHRSVDPSQEGGPTHNDAVQVLGGAHIRILDSTLEGGSNAAVQVTQTVAATTDLDISGNWIDGGGCSINLSNKGRPSMRGIRVAGNTFGAHQQYAGCALLATPSTELEQHGNAWSITRLPVSPRWMSE